MKAAQLVHGMREWIEKYPLKDRAWYRDSNYVAILEVDNEQDLIRLIQKAESRCLDVAMFREPDLDNAITAIVIEPGDQSRRMCSSIRLLR